MKGVYAMGLCGYELWFADSDSEHMMVKVRFTEADNDKKPRRYKICQAKGGRLYVRPHGCRIYLDEVLRV